MKRAQGKAPDPLFGKLVALVEGGYASGDANPYDGTIKRFTFDPNHQVGLLMFPYVLHFHTARGATNAQDPGLLARPLPGSRFLASKGGVFGASYLNPVVVFRPRGDLDLKAGAVIAVSRVICRLKYNVASDWFIVCMPSFSCPVCIAE